MTNAGDYYEQKLADAKRARRMMELAKADIAETNDPEALAYFAKNLRSAALALIQAQYVGD